MLPGSAVTHVTGGLGLGPRVQRAASGGVSGAGREVMGSLGMARWQRGWLGCPECFGNKWEVSKIRLHGRVSIYHVGFASEVFPPEEQVLCVPPPRGGGGGAFPGKEIARVKVLRTGVGEGGVGRLG